MKISVIFNIILAVIIAVICFAKHVTIVNTLPAETPAAAPVGATGDSSWLWTDFSHLDTLDFVDKWLDPKDEYARFRAIATYHNNGIVAMEVFTRNLDYHCKPAKERCYLFQELSFYSPNGYKIAEDTHIMEYKEFLAGILVPKGGVLWDCTVSKGKTKNPSACPEPAPDTHVYNHQVKDK